jgi:uncharacterized membrane protein YedE/YeeE
MHAQIVISFIVGLFFSVGLCLSGMTLPQNILSFLDVQHWNPILLFVMIGAILVYSIGYRLITLRSRPLLANKFEIPTNRTITYDLVAGAAIFGVGWGLGGFCGGPAIASLVAGRPQVFVFVGAMLFGMLVCDRSMQYLKESRAAK